MGWASRAKQSQGNPEHAKPQIRCISDREVNEARRVERKLGRSGAVRVRFSDRAYVMDPRGVLHRVPPTPAPLPPSMTKNQPLEDSKA
jgi:hypothetical protein